MVGGRSGTSHVWVPVAPAPRAVPAKAEALALRAVLAEAATRTSPRRRLLREQCQPRQSITEYPGSHERVTYGG